MIRHRPRVVTGVVTAACVAALTGAVAAQTGRVGGTVKDESGQAIKGATVTAENESAAPASYTATTDEKGRFSIIGLRGGMWTFTAQAPGFGPEGGKMNVATVGSPNPPITFTLKKAAAPAPSALGSLAAKDLQAELAAADELYNSGKFEDAITAYRDIMAKAPALSVISLQIAAAYRNLRQYDQAIAAYTELLKIDPNNDKAQVGIGMTDLEKGDLQAAEQTLANAAASGSATREVLYNLGEVKFAKGQADEAAQWYQKASEADPTWGKPLFKLGLVALNKGDRPGALALMEKVIAIDPASPEAGQAKAVIAQLKQ